MEISLNEVSKRYGKVHALDKVTFTLPPGQLVSLLGVNGAGKTTLLRCLSTIAAPTKGTIFYDSVRLGRDRIDLRKRLAFLPDFPTGMPQHTILQHIGLILRLYEIDPSTREARILELLEEFDLLPYIEKPLAELSRGQLYKAALSAVLVCERDLLLLDEPFASGMDPNGIASLKRELRAATDRGATVFYSTQILEIAETFSDYACVLDGGELRYFAPISELRSQTSDVEGGVLEGLFKKLREDRRA